MNRSLLLAPWVLVCACATPSTSAGLCGFDGGAVLDSFPALGLAGDPGAAPLGYGDPSLAYAPDASVGFLTYTAVGPSAASTRIARSGDRGASWTYVGAVNQVTPLTLATSNAEVCGASTCAGSWVHEVSSLVEDPTDPDPARRFKVFGHSYFIAASGGLHYEIGSIDLWTSGDVSATATWAETRLLGWSSSSPRSSSGVQTVVSTDPALAPLLGSCLALTEPGALVLDGVIHLALSCVRFESATSIPIEIELLRSADHGASWQPVSTLISVADARLLGASGPTGPQASAADLFVAQGRPYLFVTPSGPVTSTGATTNGYRGCVVIPFEQLSTGTLARCAGGLAVSDSFAGPPGLFNGACTWAEGAPGAGVMMLSADATRPSPWRISSTGLGPR
jgi:hypothetical protein